ncbi:MAG: hypothetical protein HUK26_03645 [Duodenibacillus sp.]|nr:hypothetical protein [Duodenibacillus sp.]
MQEAFALAAAASPLARIAPRARLASACLLSLCVATLPGLAAPALALAAGLALAAAARPPLPLLARRWLAVNGFVALLWLVTPWTAPGEAVAALGPVEVTREGLLLCASATLKCNALFFAFVALVASLRFTELARALAGLKLPDKLALLVLFTARGVGIFEAEWRVMRDAARLKGFAPRTDARTYRTVAGALAMLLARALRRARVMDEAMRLRGFAGRLRTLRTETWGPAETLFVAAAAAVCAALGAAARLL